ncbi:MAG TPA: glycosyltransferase [Gemmatimonadales bacterium]|jgi:glycosyltransferase involved in cell wall biosynthesis|nr:glycosyltransferase [Gemmatimonadales bacterium]
MTNGSAQPLVSIVLPTYNGAAYLSEAIDSCLAQTYRHWELILVDDCSTDATARIIADYASRDPRIRSIRHETNKKLPEALNTGHAAARGDHLMWTSDDNRFLPSAIQEMTSFLNQHPQVGLVYADSVLIDEKGRYVRDYPAQPASALAYMNAIGPCFLYRRSVYERVGAYSADLFLAEDYDYWLRTYREFEVAHLQKTLYEYRWHGESLTMKAPGAAVWASVERTLRLNLPYLHRLSRPERARGWIVCAATAARRRAPLQAAGALGKALKLAPMYSLRYLGRKVLEKSFGIRSNGATIPS